MIKAMGTQSDQEIVELIGGEAAYTDYLSASLEEAASAGILTREQALDYLGSKVRERHRRGWQRQAKPKADEARDLLANVVLSHIPLHDFDFRPKVILLTFVIRRCIVVFLCVTAGVDMFPYVTAR